MITLFENFENKKIIVYRGSRKDLKIPPDGIRYFTSNPKTASFFGEVVYIAEIVLENPFVVDAMENRWLEIPRPKKIRIGIDKYHQSTPKPTVDTDLIVHWAYKKGYDGVIIKNVIEGMGNTIVADDYIIFDTKNILSFKPYEF